MEHFNQIVALIGGIIATVLLPLMTAFQFYDSKKRKEAAAAKKAEADNITQYAAEWKKCYEEEREVEDTLNKKIDQLYVEKEEDRKRIRELQEENFKLKLDKQALEFIRCNNALKCVDRDPPNEFIKKAANKTKEESK
nr:MAG TPA: tail length tape measure protein [Caudoviricetes sp.]